MLKILLQKIARRPNEMLKKNYANKSGLLSLNAVYMRKIGQILSIWLSEPTHTPTSLTLLTLHIFTMGYIYYECF